jgi:acyl carrier protein
MCAPFRLPEAAPEPSEEKLALELLNPWLASHLKPEQALETFSADLRFDQLGLDMHAVIDLIMDIEERYGVDLNRNDSGSLDRLVTFGDLARAFLAAEAEKEARGARDAAKRH